MGVIKVNVKHNLVKLILFQALALQPNWYDVPGLCRLTGLRWCTVSSHVGFWSVGLKDKHGMPIGLLKRRPSHRGYRLVWEYDLGAAGRSWLSNVDPELLHDVAIQLAARWHRGDISYNTPGIDPLNTLTTLLKPNKPLDVIVLSRSDKVYLKYNNHIICFSSSSWVGHNVNCIPEKGKWSADPKVVFDALVNLLGEGNVPVEPIFVKAGFQHEPAEDVAPIKLDKPLEDKPEASAKVIYNPADFFIPGVLWKEVQISRADVIENDDSPEVEQQKRARLMERAQAILKKRELDSYQKKPTNGSVN